MVHDWWVLLYGYCGHSGIFSFIVFVFIYLLSNSVNLVFVNERNASESFPICFLFDGISLVYIID